MSAKNEILSITKGPRLANFELLRIFAMFLVLVYHADFWTLGEPSSSELTDTPVSSLTRVVIESISVICVNVFLMISGWFKIKLSLRGFFNYIFQCLFISALLYCIALVSGQSFFSIGGIRECLYFTPFNWFVKTYLALFLISPVLNAFIESASEKIFRNTLIGLFTFEFIFGITGIVGFINMGTSCYSFICLYLLSSYIRIHFYPRFTKQKLLKFGIILTCFAIVINALLYLISIIKVISIPLVTYISPIVILQSIGLILIFSGIQLRPNKAITFLAESSFAVYLVHTNINIRDYFKNAINYIYIQNSGVKVLFYIFVFLLIIFFSSVILDKLRLFIWKYIQQLRF